MKGDKIGNLDPAKLHYMSLSFFEDVEFGRARLAVECTDFWLDQKLSMPGCTFKADAPQLSPAEIEKVPGALVATGSVDRLKLEVCARDGARIVIKPDEDRYWKAQGGTIAEEYQALKEDHEKNFEKLLGNIMQSQATPGAPAVTPGGDQADEAPADSSVVELESISKLKEIDIIEEEHPSEVPDVNIIRCKSGKVYLFAKKDKSLTKYCQLGGFGTGGYVSASDSGPAVAWNVTSDKSVVQIDDSTIRPDATSITCMSLYKLLVTLEKTKRISEHKVSYLDVKRKDQTDEELDGFTVTVRNAQKFKPMKNPNGRDEKASSKNMFNRCIETVEKSPYLLVAFRFRFERVGGTLKVQKPYIVTASALQLTKERPVQVGQHCWDVGQPDSKYKWRCQLMIEQKRS